MNIAKTIILKAIKTQYPGAALITIDIHDRTYTCQYSDGRVLSNSLTVEEESVISQYADIFETPGLHKIKVDVINRNIIFCGDIIKTV